MSRDAKAAARTKVYTVPADTQWVEVPDEGHTDKPRYAHEVGRRWQAQVVCPDCGDTVKVSTDQNPAEPTTFDAAIKAAAQQQSEA